MPNTVLKPPVFKQLHNISEANVTRSFKQVSQKAQEANFKPSAADANHILSVYNEVVKDGRYVKTFSKDPEGVAAKLGLKLTPQQASEVGKAAGFSSGSPVSDDVELVAVAVIVIIVVLKPDGQVIVDSSGMVKA